MKGIILAGASGTRLYPITKGASKQLLPINYKPMIYYGHSFTESLHNAVARKTGATVFGYYVTDSERFRTVEFDSQMRAISIEEKSKQPKSSYAVTGLYFYDNDVIDIAKTIRPSHRSELEITSVNNAYLENGNLNVELLGRGYAWLETGTHDSLLDAGHLLKVAGLEEIGFINKWISTEQLIAEGKSLSKAGYGQYLLKIAGQPKA